MNILELGKVKKFLKTSECKELIKSLRAKKYNNNQITNEIFKRYKENKKNGRN